MKLGLFLTTRIGRRFLAVLLVISLLPLALAGFISIRRAESTLREQTVTILRTASNGSEAQLREFLRQLKRQALQVARDQRVHEALRSELSHSQAADTLPPRLADMILSAQEGAPDVLEILILSSAGRVVASSSRDSIGADLSSSDYFHGAQRAFFFGDVFKNPATGLTDWVIAAPILSENPRQLLGVAALRVNPRSLSDLTSGRRVLAEGADTQSLRIGDSGETYIVNRQHFMITESRYSSNSVLSVKVDTLPVRVAFDEGHEIAADYTDYRGIAVSGASIVLRDCGWVVLSEIDFTQVFAPIRRLRWELIGILFGVAWLAAFLAWTSTRRIIRPIRMLTESDESLAAGDETHALASETSLPDDEIGELVRRRNVRVKTLIANQQQLKERTFKLREMVSELEHISYAIVHDLRAPLRAMHVFADLLRNEGPETSPEDRAKYLRYISTAATRLDHLTQDVLTYNRTVLHTPELGPVDLQPLIQGILDTYPNLQSHNADISIDGTLPSVIGNPALLTQCFANLLDNAVKFVTPGGRARVRIFAEVSGNSPDDPVPLSILTAGPVRRFVRIIVADNGVGIPLSAQPRLFRMFQRITHDHEGNGLGLAIVSKVVERMGGRVGVQSEPGKGSRFWLELRAAS